MRGRNPACGSLDPPYKRAHPFVATGNASKKMQDTFIDSQRTSDQISGSDFDQAPEPQRTIRIQSAPMGAG
jgi:hypothetical protein